VNCQCGNYPGADRLRFHTPERMNFKTAIEGFTVRQTHQRVGDNAPRVHRLAVLSTDTAVGAAEIRKQESREAIFGRFRASWP